MNASITESIQRKTAATSRSFMISNVCTGEGIQIGPPARYRLYFIYQFRGWHREIVGVRFHSGIASLRYHVIFFQLRINDRLLVEYGSWWRRDVDSGPTPRP